MILANQGSCVSTRNTKMGLMPGRIGRHVQHPSRPSSMVSGGICISSAPEPRTTQATSKTGHRDLMPGRMYGRRSGEIDRSYQSLFKEDIHDSHSWSNRHTRGPHHAAFVRGRQGGTHSRAPQLPIRRTGPGCIRRCRLRWPHPVRTCSPCGSGKKTWAMARLSGAARLNTC